MMEDRAGAASRTARFRSAGFRLWGLLPAALFLARLLEYSLVRKAPVHVLWSCHISNLLLGVGMFLANVRMIRVASFLLIMGVLPWIMDMAVIRQIVPLSLLSHLAGAGLTLFVLRQVRVAPNDWVFALIFFLALQQLTRLLTDPGPYTNINLAHHAYAPWKDLFTTYWKYWIANCALVATALRLIEWGLIRIFPAARNHSP